MSEQNLSAMTVIELRKLARELHVPLSAGISKQGIIERLSQAIGASAPDAPAGASPAVESAEAAKPAEPEAPAAQEPAAPEKPAAEPTAAPGFRQAYAAPRFNTKPAYQAPAFHNRPAAPRAPAAMETQRPQATRPTGFTPRFGPAAQEPPAAPREEERPVRPEQPVRPAYEQRPAFEQPARPAYEQRPAFEQPARPAYEQRPAYQAERRPAYNDNARFQQPARPAYEQRQVAEAPVRPAYEQRPAFDQPARPAYEQRPAAAPGANPAVNEMLSAGECVDGAGVLELHPDGYGFLRSDSLLPSARDIYVSAAQVRRFGLRTGDRITGKNRPLRDGDKYNAMLYITEVNGAPADGLISRPSYEDMTPIYPTRRLRLEGDSNEQTDDLRLIDLLTPMGFGQRALVQCPPNCGKSRLLKRLANAITQNNPDAAVMVLLFSETPEDVTLFRDQVKCPVLATTFDMPPENHIRLADMAVEYAQRQAEQKKDVVLLVDSLTTLSKVCTTAALQQGRQTLGAVSPTSLQKAKRLFGAARCLREGGSLTVIATMNTETGSKVDEAIVSEFRGTANLELTLSAAVAAEGVYPAIDLVRSGTRRADAIVSPEHLECLRLIRSMLGDLTPAAALKEIISMLGKTAGNAELIARIQDWAAAMRK